jgi:hypothetical protein
MRAAQRHRVRSAHVGPKLISRCEAKPISSSINDDQSNRPPNDEAAAIHMIACRDKHRKQQQESTEMSCAVSLLPSAYTSGENPML